MGSFRLQRASSGHPDTGRRLDETPVALATLIGLICAAMVLAVAPPTRADAQVLLAEWQMNEPSGATVMSDSSGNGINGAIGSAVGTGHVVNGAQAYNWPHGNPTAPPAKPERLVLVNDGRLNPGERDYAITVRFRTTNSYGNMIQKGQSTTPGGYFKWEIPKGRLTCLFRSRDSAGNLLGQLSTKSPENMPLNDGAWHTVRCERTSDRVIMTIDDSVTTQSPRGVTGPISNTQPLSIAGKANCDQVTVTCDYFAGDIDWIRIEVSSTGSSDTQAPSTPGKPSGASTGFTSTNLTWPRSTDNVSTTLLYRVFRNGTLVGTTASSATTVSYVDTGLSPGSTNTYRIAAVDMAGNSSSTGPMSDAITVQSAPLGVFVDDFSSGFAFWNAATGMTIDTSTGNPTAPSLRAQVATKAATATKLLGSPMTNACVSFKVNATTLVSNSILMRLLNGSGSPIVRVFVNSSGSLAVRSDVGATQVNSGVSLGSGWHDIELCGTIGSSSTWDLYRDGVKVINAWSANTGTNPIAGVQLGDFNARTWTANYDFVVVDQVPGTQVPGADTTPPTTPGQPTGQGVAPDSIVLSWASSTDQSPPITYRIYRDGGAAPVGQTTEASFTDTGLTSGASHTYAVDAVDSVGNMSALSPPSAPITVPALPPDPPSDFADDFSTGDFSAWTGVTRLTIDTTQGSPAAPSARAQVSGQSAFAFKNLETTYTDACFSARVNATSLGGTSVDLFRLRTATNGPIIRAFVNASGILAVRSDFAGVQVGSGVALGSGWHEIELCGTVGSSGTWDLYRDGVKIVNAWTSNTGSVPIGRVQIGDTAAKTFTVHFDQVRLDLSPG